MASKTLLWKVHTPGLLREVLNNEGAQILLRPLQGFAGLLSAVATRASQLNDPELNKLMCRLSLYAIADPECPDYDPKRLREILGEDEEVFPSPASQSPEVSK